MYRTGLSKLYKLWVNLWGEAVVYPNYGLNTEYLQPLQVKKL